MERARRQTARPTRSAGAPWSRRLRHAASALVLALCASATAGAQEEPAEEPAGTPAPEAAPFAVQPSGVDGPGGRDYFVYSLTPGETFGDTVAVSNLGDRPINFVIYPADAFNVKDEGGFTAARDGEEAIGVGSWITLKAQTYTVEPGTRIDVPFSITVPEDAEPGDHAGAILATDADRGSINVDGTDPNLVVRERVGARVYVRVEGPISPALRIDKLDVQRKTPSFAVPFFSTEGQVTVSWEVSNTGNTRLTPTAVLEVKGLFGRTIKTLPAEELPELLPGSNIVRSAIITGLPPLEKITVELTVTADEVEVVGTASYWAVPWRFVALVLLLLAALIGWRIIRRRRVGGADPPSSRPREMVDA